MFVKKYVPLAHATGFVSSNTRVEPVDVLSPPWMVAEPKYKSPIVVVPSGNVTVLPVTSARSFAPGTIVPPQSPPQFAATFHEPVVGVNWQTPVARPCRGTNADGKLSTVM